MTHREAIDYINLLLCDELHSKPDIYSDNTYKFIEALEEFAIPALEKQIYKKPITKRELGTSHGRPYYACPYCDEFIKYKYSRYSLDRQTDPDCCEFCGQALDWE